MLQQLTIKNYILIEDICVNLTDHFNVFTGETGAGKSMLVDALGFVSGQRSSSSVVGKKGDEAFVEAIFDIENHPVREQLIDMGFMESDDTLITIQRKMGKDGKSSARLNYKAVNLSIVKDIFSSLVDIHSQHENQYLLNVKNHRLLLDSYAQTQDTLAIYQEAFNKHQEALKQQKTLQKSQIDSETIKSYRKEIDVFDAFKFSVDDYDFIKAELKNMESYEENMKQFSNVLNIFESGKVLQNLFELRSAYETIDNTELYHQFNDAYFQIEDAHEQIIQLKDQLNFDPFEFDRMQDRVFSYQKYIRKHGSPEGVIDFFEDLRKTIETVDNFEDYLVDAQRLVETTYQDLIETGKKLREKRQKAAKNLSRDIALQLHDLLLDHARFEVKFDEVEPHSFGLDTIVFTISLNAGEALRPLHLVASGGEISRLMLALKIIFSSIYGITTIVFDEIDTGVSGRAGVEIGQKMRTLGASIQVLTISHLSSVAAAAQNHFAIEKASKDSSTVTSIRHLEHEERIEHLALIMSGNINEASLMAAKMLLEEGAAS